MSTPAGAPRRILAVDDDANALDAVRQILTQQGYDVTTAPDGDAAIDLLRAETFDLALLDVGLPGLFSGYDLCRGIRQDARMRDIPVIFLTGHGMVMDEKQGEDAGSDLYLVKPVLASRLINMVGMFLSPQGPLRAKRRAR
ncbi:MAG TPA: response regulator [Vicinamibacteria bacterium]|nr:response regulator [Vicinamibacteria bacterium]